MMLSEAHQQILQLKYGLQEAMVTSVGENASISSLNPAEVRSYLGKENVDSTGLLIKYPGNGSSTIRLDNPTTSKKGRPQKYLRRPGEPNSLFVPPGVNLESQTLWITEGELKALCGRGHGLEIVGLSGVFCWRTEGELTALLSREEKLSDEEALLPELTQINWNGKEVNLLYDSDITPGHPAYEAFPRLAEQLYRMGAQEVRILSLPSPAKDQKTGLDEFFLDRKESALKDLQTMRDRTLPYLPIKAGTLVYAERLIKSKDLEDVQKAAVAYLGAKNEASTIEWLKTQTEFNGKIRDAVLSEAKKRLKNLRTEAAKPGFVSQEDLPELGPEYDHVKELLEPYLDQYGIDQFGRLGKIVETKKFSVLVDICNFVAWPTRDILKDNGIAKDRFIELQGLFRGVHMGTVQISSKDFQEMRWVIPAWGTKAAIQPKMEQEVRYALQLMAGAGIPETTVYTHLGWRKIAGKWVYLHSHGAVGADKGTVEVEIADRLRRYALPAGITNIKTALKASLELLRIGPAKIMYPLYAGIWLAPLCEILRIVGVEPSYTVYLWGESGSFKSTIVALLISHFGNFNRNTLPASFKDTKLSIPEMAFVCKDIILVVDDLYPALSPKERLNMLMVLEHIIRTQGDRQGRGKLTSATELKEGHPPRGLVYITGESLSLLGSTLARTTPLCIKKGDIDKEKLAKAREPAQQALLAEAMVGFLAYLASQMEELASQLLEDFEGLRKKAAGQAKVVGRHERNNETVAFLYLGFDCFIRFAVEQDAITEEEANKLLQEAWTTLNEEADELARLAESVAPTKKFFEALLELQTLGRIYFANMVGIQPDTIEVTPGTVKVGWGPDENGDYYLLWGPAWEQITKYLKTQNEELPLTKSSMLDALEQQGLLGASQGGRRVIVKRIAEKETRVLPILAKALDIEEKGANEA